MASFLFAANQEEDWGLFLVIPSCVHSFISSPIYLSVHFTPNKVCSEFCWLLSSVHTGGSSLWISVSPEVLFYSCQSLQSLSGLTIPVLTSPTLRVAPPATPARHCNGYI